MKTEVTKLLDEISFEHSMNQYAVEGAAKLLRLVINSAGVELLNQEPFDCLEGLWSLLDKIEKDMKATEAKIGDLIKSK